MAATVVEIDGRTVGLAVERAREVVFYSSVPETASLEGTRHPNLAALDQLLRRELDAHASEA